MAGSFLEENSGTTKMIAVVILRSPEGKPSLHYRKEKY